MVTAHRGHYYQEPENSLAAIRAAAELGVEVVEIDVRATADNVLVLMHDDTIGRTTTGTGAVAMLSYEELSNHHLKIPGTQRTSSERPPRFEEALALAKELKVAIYLDQKTDRHDLVFQALEASQAQDLVIIRVGLHGARNYLQLSPNLIVMPTAKSAEDLEKLLVDLPKLKIVEVSGIARQPKLYRLAQEKGIKVQQDVLLADISAYAGDYSLWKEYVDGGVFLLQTNFSELLMPAIWQYRRSGTFPSRGPKATRD